MQRDFHGTRAWVAIFFILGAFTATLTHHLIVAGITPGLDFASFYAAGTLYHRHGGAELYDRSLQESTLKALHVHHPDLYYVHPPFEMLAFAPLAWLPLNTAYALWTAFNFITLLASAAMLLRMFPLGPRWYLAVICFLSLPVLHGLGEGEDSCILLLSVCACYLLMQRLRPLAAGVALALMAIKFHYLIILAVLLFIAGKYRVLKGLVIGLIGLIVLSIAFVGVHGISDYIRFLRTFNANGLVPMSLQYFPNVRGFFHRLGWGQIPTLVTSAAMVVAAGYAMRRSKDNVLSFSLCITTALVASPYGHIADAALLVFPLLVAFQNAARSLLATAAMVIIIPFVIMLSGSYQWNLCFLVFFLFLAVLFRECIRQPSAAVAAQAPGVTTV